MIAPLDGLYGIDPQAVLETLKDRTAQLARGAGRDDGRKLALVIEGGSMRGVLSAGGVVALSRMGMQHTFDDLFATSAGVMNAAYFLSGQPDLGISIYYEDLATNAFINPRRFWKIIDVDYVFDHVVVKSKPLDVATLRQSPTRFHVSMIDCATAERLMVDAAHGPAPTLACLKAATAIPVLYNRCIEVLGRRCMDGGMLNPFPLQDAIDAGCTDILVLLSRPAAYIRQPLSWPNRMMFELLCARGRSSHSALLRNYHRIDRQLRQLALGQSPVPPGVRIATLCPPPGSEIGRSHHDHLASRRGANLYCENVLRIFGQPESLAQIAPPRA